MHSKDPRQALEDILINILRIEGHTAALDMNSFMASPMAYDAVERCLERISEAAKRAGELATELCPEIAWPKIRALGNVLRHEYDRVEGFRLWYMVENDLPPLKTAIERAIRRL